MAILLLAGLIYLPIFLRSFLCPRHAHVLNVYFGVPGSGKTTFAAYLTRKRAEGKHYNVALSHAAKKLVRLIFALEKSRQPYCPAA